MSLLQNLDEIIFPPLNCEFLLRKQKSIKRTLLQKNISRISKRIAILGGSTTSEIRNLLEIFLLAAGIEPKFYESEYNRYYEDAVFCNSELKNFNPELIIIFTSAVNIVNRPNITDDVKIAQEKISAEFKKFEEMWRSIEKNFNALIIQNNFDYPFANPLGNFGAVSGLERYINILNQKFSEYAAENKNFYIHDLNRLSAKIGLDRWHNRREYCAYKFAMSYDVMPEVAFNLSKIIKSVWGFTKKCLVLDLDNTLWGGIIGDVGVENLQIGHETPEAEMFTEFQNYVLDLKNRGIILAVCSKNEEFTAKSGFDHPDSVLKFSDFAAFRANWQPKSENILEIVRELNIGIDSVVFIDDNPAERQLVRENLPQVSVPEVIGGDAYSYIQAIENAGYFEPVTISEDDLKRNENYLANNSRKILETSAKSYDDFLKSLEMQAEISPFKEIYFDRIAQLTNKTNQFNLTTRRHTRAEIEQMSADSKFITLYCRLKDKFGDNGLISVLIAEKKNDELEIILWLMSCRVFNRGVENIIIDSLVERAKAENLRTIRGVYLKTAKNKIVAEIYKNFGFKKISQDGEDSIWELNVSEYVPQGKFIDVKEA